MSQNPQPLQSHAAPVHVETVTLLVRDLDRVARFYTDTIGLEVISATRHGVALGNDGVVLIALQGDSAAKIPPNGAPGLFHTAFLLPERKHLGEWLRQARDNHWSLDGAADHLVSEAVYLTDPEGNGIEIYVDRPRSAWTFEGEQVRMSNARIDMGGLLALAEAHITGKPYRMPPGARIGHVHLCVPTLAEAAQVLNTQWGLDVMCQYPGASFFSWGGYHHHIAANVWNSKQPAIREAGQTGLQGVRLMAHDAISHADLSQRWLLAGGAQNDAGTSITAFSGLNFSLAL